MLPMPSRRRSASHASRTAAPSDRRTRRRRVNEPSLLGVWRRRRSGCSTGLACTRLLLASPKGSHRLEGPQPSVNPGKLCRRAPPSPTALISSQVGPTSWQPFGLVYLRSARNSKRAPLDRLAIGQPRSGAKYLRSLNSLRAFPAFDKGGAYIGSNQLSSCRQLIKAATPR